MAGTDDELPQFLEQIAGEEAFFAGETQADDNETRARMEPPAEPPLVSLMITNRQRAQLRALGVSDEAIRSMTPTEAHERLGLTKPDR